MDNKTGKRTSLRTGSEGEARQIVEAKNQAERQPVLNLQIAKACLAGTNNGITTRTWQHAIEALTNTKQGANRERWLRVVKDRALVPLLPRVIIETQGELMLRVLQTGTVSTNVYLRRLHNFCVDMNWLPWPLVPKRQWPAVRFKDERAITWDEHCKIVARELNLERKAFYQLAWHLGASQSDLAHLQAEDVDWQARIICFVRMKTRWRGQQPPQRKEHPDWQPVACTRAKTEPGAGGAGHEPGDAGDKQERKHEHRQRVMTRPRQPVAGQPAVGQPLHSYRYAWAEGAKTAGYPERFAQMALGHNSKAVHRAYAKKAQVTLPPLEEYERKIVPLNPGNAVLPAQDGQEQPAPAINA